MEIHLTHLMGFIGLTEHLREADTFEMKVYYILIPNKRLKVTKDAYSAGQVEW